MAQRFALATPRALGLIFATKAALAVGLTLSATALAQPPPAGKPQAPPGTHTDAEFDPDAKPPPPKEKELPPPEPNAWGVGGAEEEGKFAPQKKKKVEEDEDDKEPVKLDNPGSVSLDFVAGFGAIRDIHDDAKKTKVTALSFLPGFRYRIGDSFMLKARFPITHTNTTAPTNSYNTNAVGNAEIGAQYAIGLTKRLRLPIDLAFDLPTAAGDAFGDNVAQGQAVVNQAAAATRGWEENPLFTSKRVGIRMGGGITYDRKALHVAASTRLDIMIKASGNPATNDLQGNKLSLRKTNIAWVTNASLFYDFFDGKLAPGLRMWFVYATMPIYSASTDYSGPQFVLEPDVSGKFPLNADGSLAIRAVLGFIIPAGGVLGGQTFKGESASADGFRARVEFLF